MTEQEDNTSNTGPASTETDETPDPGTSGTPDAENGAQRSMPREQRYRLERNQAREALADAETRFAELQARLEQAQRAEVERIAGETLAVGADLFLGGRELAEFLTESGGGVDAEKVAAAVAAVLADRPGLQKPKFPAGYDPTQGYGGRTDPKREPTLVDLFKGSTRQPY